MKRNLLVLSLSALALGASAQVAVQSRASMSRVNMKPSLQKVTKIVAEPKTLDAPFATSVLSQQQVVQSRRSLKAFNADPTFTVQYGLPEGTYSFGMINSPEYFGYVYKSARIFTPGLKDVTFPNYTQGAAANATYSWLVGDSTITTKDLTYNTFGIFYPPTLTVTSGGVSSSYQYSASSSHTTYWCAGTDSIVQLDTYNPFEEEGPYNGFQGGGNFVTHSDFYNIQTNSTTGKAGWNNTGHKTVGYVVVFPSNGDSTYVYGNHFIVAGSTDLKAAINTAHPITLTLATASESGLNPFKTATCDSSSIYKNKTGKFYSLNFKFQDSDPILGTTDAPFTLPNEDVYAIYTGFDAIPDSVFGLFYSANGEAGNAYALLDNGSMATIGYSNYPNVPQVNFMAGFDGVLPVAKSLMNDTKVRFPEAGGVGVTETINGQDYNDYDVATLTQASTDYTPWTVESAPEWINGYQAQDMTQTSSDGTTGFTGITAFYFSAEALPAGTDYRAGNVVMSLYGKRLSIPVEQKSTTGITSLDAEKTLSNAKPVYFNAFGQRVSADTKGLVITSEGKKYINKK